MTLDGRREARVRLAVPIYLLDVKRGAQPPELALTENVSSSGACVVTKWRREPGEHERLTLISGEAPIHAEVVYCHPMLQHNYYVGLRLQERCADWWSAEAGPGPLSISRLLNGAELSGRLGGNRGRR
jgi:hypothetical protein